MSSFFLRRRNLQNKFYSSYFVCKYVLLEKHVLDNYIDMYILNYLNVSTHYLQYKVSS